LASDPPPQVDTNDGVTQASKPTLDRLLSLHLQYLQRRGARPLIHLTFEHPRIARGELVEVDPKFRALQSAPGQSPRPQKGPRFADEDAILDSDACAQPGTRLASQRGVFT